MCARELGMKKSNYETTMVTTMAKAAAQLWEMRAWLTIDYIPKPH